MDKYWNFRDFQLDFGDFVEWEKYWVKISGEIRILEISRRVNIRDFEEPELCFGDEALDTITNWKCSQIVFERASPLNTNLDSRNFGDLDIHEMLSDPGKRFPCRRFDEKTSRIPKFRGIPVHGTDVQKLFEKFSSSRFSSSFLKSPNKCIDAINPFVRRIQARFNRFEIENIDPPPAPPPPLSLPSSAATW